MEEPEDNDGNENKNGRNRFLGRYTKWTRTRTFALTIDNILGFSRWTLPSSLISDLSVCFHKATHAPYDNELES